MSKRNYLRLGMIAMTVFVVSLGAAAECVRWKKEPGSAPDLDGPGSFGPLQGTVTLDCLRYVRSVQKHGKEHVVIADERGATYELSVGHYMGENAGLITKIDGRFIYLRQVVRQGEDWVERTVKFPKVSRDSK